MSRHGMNHRVTKGVTIVTNTIVKIEATITDLQSRRAKEKIKKSFHFIYLSYLSRDEHKERSSEKRSEKPVEKRDKPAEKREKPADKRSEKTTENKGKEETPKKPEDPNKPPLPAGIHDKCRRYMLVGNFFDVITLKPVQSHLDKMQALLKDTTITKEDRLRHTKESLLAIGDKIKGILKSENLTNIEQVEE